MYKVGQIVKVVNQGLEAYGSIGEIVDVDETWGYPYEIKFEGAEFEQDLYGHSDIQIYIGNNTKDKKVKSIEDAIAELIIIVGVEKYTRENALTVTKLQEARMWYIEGKKIHEKENG